MRRLLLRNGFLVLLMGVSLMVSAQSYTIGLIKDGSGKEFDELTQNIETEIRALSGISKDIRFKALNADWQSSLSRQHLNTFMADDEVDMIIALGYISSDLVAHLDNYPKPVIASTILDKEWQQLAMLPDNSSGIPNFAWIDSFVRLKADIHQFAQAFNVRQPVLILPQELYTEFPELVDFLKTISKNYEWTVVPVDADTKVGPLLQPGTDAAIVLPLVQHSPAYLMGLFQELNEQSIPSLVINGPGYLEYGATTTFSNVYLFQKLARRLALRVLKVTEGHNLSGLSAVDMQGQAEVVVNMEGLRQMGLFPKWSFLEDAVLLNVTIMPGEELTLQQAVARALENNIEGKLAHQDVLLADMEVKIARANALPQLSVSGTGVQLSSNLVEASMGQRGEFTVTGSATLQQIIYSESVFANMAIKKLLAEHAEISGRQAALDVVVDVSAAYIALMHARNNWQIKNDNVQVNRQNRAMAKMMEAGGEGSISDLNRWETELSLSQIELGTAEANYKVAMYRLNELLNQPIDQTIALPVQQEMESLVLNHQAVLLGYFENPLLTELLADFLLEEMYLHSPEWEQLLSAGKIVDRQKAMHIRKMYRPEVALFGGADQAFIREGTIKNPQLPVPAPPDNITWNVGLRVSLPLFEGGRKKAEVQRSTIEQEKIAWQQADLVNRMESGIRSNVQLLLASYREVSHSESAAKAAEENYKITRNAYAQGAISVTQLIDAQNAMYRTRQLALTARSKYVLNFIKTERLQGYFSFLEPEQEKAAYKRKLTNYLTEKK